MLKVKIKKTLSGFLLESAFSIDQETLAILGPSGSGKTMTLRCIAGLLQPDEGYIELNGRVLFDSSRGINRPPQQRAIGFVFQNYALFPHLTVSQNIAFGISHQPKPQIREKVAKLLNRMKINELADRYPRQLSAGQQQRVALARALAPEPEALLLDEPFSALDTQLKESLEHELQELPGFYSGTVLLVTHNLAEAYRLGSKIAVYQGGQLLQFSSKNELVDSPANPAVARATGVKNLLAGAIIDISESEAWVFIPGLGKVRITTEKLKLNGLSKNQPVTIGIRQENIQLTNREGENTFPATIARAAAGLYYNSYLLTPGAESENPLYLEADQPRAMQPLIEPSQTCRIYLPPECLFIIT